MEEADDHDEYDDHDENADDDGCVQTHYGCILRHKHPEADPKQKCDGNHREANADHMCKYVRQFQFQRMQTDPHKALARLCQAANNCN